MEVKIKSITEAFSMQPITHYANENAIGPLECKEIKKGEIIINGEYFDYYIGYNPAGEKLFEFRCETVSVEYKID